MKKPNTNGGGTAIQSEHTSTFQAQKNKSLSNSPANGNAKTLGTNMSKDVKSKPNPMRKF